MKFGKRLKDLERPGWVYIDYKARTAAPPQIVDR
jgi:hypothetical protein